MFQLVWKVVLPIVWRTPDFVWWLKILHLALFISVMHYAVVFEHSYRGEQSAADFKLDDGSFLLFSFPVKRHKIWFYMSAVFGWSFASLDLRGVWTASKMEFVTSWLLSSRWHFTWIEVMDSGFLSTVVNSGFVSTIMFVSCCGPVQNNVKSH